MRSIVSLTVLALSALPLPAAAAELPDAIAAHGEALVTTAHAVGAQVYECKFDTAGNLIWQFREPIATLFIGGKTVGRHYAGPDWEMTDGSSVRAKVSGRAPSADPRDIPLLRLDVASRHGEGQLADVTTIQRINTRGGLAEGDCGRSGELLSVPYSADYAFYRKHD
jgi:hypothetical protein